MVHTFAYLDAKIYEYENRINILNNADAIDRYGKRDDETKREPGREVYYIKSVYILRGKKRAAEWAMEYLPGFAVDLKTAQDRVMTMIEQESGDRETDDLCEILKHQGKRQEKEYHDRRWLSDKIHEYNQIAWIIYPGIMRRGLQGLDDNTQEIAKLVKVKFIELNSTEKVAAWAFDEIPGFSVSMNKAKIRVNWILDHDDCCERVKIAKGCYIDIDGVCKKLRNRKA